MYSSISLQTNNIEASLKQLIIFQASNEEFGIPIESVREIIKMTAITSMPNSPESIKGIINVRGEIVTAIDIKSLLSLEGNNHINEQKHIIVTKQKNCLFGLIVDEVIEVFRIQSQYIKSPPFLISKINERYIGGVMTYENRIIILLDFNNIFSQLDLSLINSALINAQGN